MFTCKTTDTQSVEIKGRNIKGIQLSAVLFAAAGGTAMTGVLVDQTRIRLKVYVKRANGTYNDIYNDQIRYINALSGFTLPFFEYFQNSTLETQIANAAFVVQKGTLPMFVDFKQTYALESGDSMFIEVNTTGFTSDSSVSSSASYIEVYPLDAQDGQADASHTEINVYNIQAGKTADMVVLGDGVTDVLFLNFDKSTILDSDSPISTATLDSKEFKVNNITQNGLLGYRNRIFPSVALSDTRHQSFYLYSGAPINSAELSLTLNGANVNASQNYVVWIKRNFTSASLARGARHSATQQAQILTRAGLHSAATAVKSSVAPTSIVSPRNNAWAK